MSDALDLFSALADPTRIRIMLLVRRMELAIGELADVLEQSQPRVSRHVRILADAGLVRRSKEGAWVYVRLGELVTTAALLGVLDAAPIDDAGDAARLAAVRAARDAAAAAFFAAHAESWDRLRSAHVAESEIEAAIIAALGGRPLGRLLDVGTGTGRMIELLGARAQAATGIDRSPEMLRLARGRIERAGLAHAEVRRGDMFALPQADASCDTVVLHQVLHFADAPAAAVEEAARVLAPGGRLLIADFAPHEREELRTAQAHARLGFEAATVSGWLAAAGLDAHVAATLTPPPGIAEPLTVTLWVGERPPLAQAEAA